MNVPTRHGELFASEFGLLFNFDGTVQSGLGDPRQVQIGLRYVY